MKEKVIFVKKFIFDGYNSFLEIIEKEWPLGGKDYYYYKYDENHTFGDDVPYQYNKVYSRSYADVGEVVAEGYKQIDVFSRFL